MSIPHQSASSSHQPLLIIYEKHTHHHAIKNTHDDATITTTTLLLAFFSLSQRLPERRLTTSHLISFHELSRRIWPRSPFHDHCSHDDATFQTRSTLSLSYHKSSAAAFLQDAAQCILMSNRLLPISAFTS